MIGIVNASKESGVSAFQKTDVSPPRSSNRSICVLWLIGLFCIGVLLGSGAQAASSSSAEQSGAGAPKYKKYTRRSKKTRFVPLATLVAARDSVRIRLFSDDSGVVATELVTPLSDLYNASSGFVLTDDGFSVLGQQIEFGEVAKVTDSVYRDPDNSLDKVVSVILWTSNSKTGAAFKSSGSRLQSRKETRIPTGGFIRGSIINFNSNVIVDGEVNHSVIVFGGNVTMGATGVVRDHIVALGGSVTIAEGSKVYGYILPKVSGRRVRRPERPWTTAKQRLSFVPSFTYNRVDGFAPRIGWKFTDSDSLLPDLKLTYGLATTPERQRYRLSVRQPLLRDGRLSIKGAAYKELKSDDDYLLPEWQNTLYALLTTTDYKNYYETDGGSLGLEYSHLKRFTFGVDVYTDHLKAIRSTRDLWSLLGGDRRFYLNYEGIPQSLADSARVEINDKRSAGLIITATARNKREFKPRKPEWRTRATFEKALTGLDSDFSFTRFSASGVYERYLTKLSSLSLRGQINASSGNLPLYRKFFLGGYRWLRGFDHKEFMGTKSWAAAVDYGISFKGAGLGFLKFWMFYDVGQIADNVSFGDTRLLQSVGLGVAIDGGVRLNIARRLDASDPSLRVAVEF